MTKQTTTYGSHFYTVATRLSDGSKIFEHPSGWAEGSIRKSSIKDDTRVVRLRFRPSPTERRFRVVETEWGPDDGDNVRHEPGESVHTRLYDRNVSEQERAKRWSNWCDERDRRCLLFPKPTSLVDVPTDCGITDEFYQEPADFMTRPDAFECAAAWNLESLVEGANGNENKAEQIEITYTGMRWWVVVEIGQPLPLPLTYLHIDANGMGYQDQNIQTPVRLVLPTAEERAKYADVPSLAPGSATIEAANVAVNETSVA